MGFCSRIAAFSFLLISTSSLCFADIGGVGGQIGGVGGAIGGIGGAGIPAPAAPAPAPTAEKKPEVAKEKPSESEGTVIAHDQIMSVSFEGRHAYYQRELRQAVRRNSEQANYEIITYYPTSRDRMQTQRSIYDANERAQRMRTDMIDMGVPPGSIAVRAKALPANKPTPEVKLYTY